MIEFFKKLSWFRLFIGLIIAFIIAYLYMEISLHIKTKVFEFLFESGRVKFSNGNDLQAWVDSFNSSLYWLPLDMVGVAIVAAVSTFYILKTTKGAKFENGLMLGALSALLIYQLNPLMSFTCIGVSTYISHKASNRKSHNHPMKTDEK